MSVCIVNRAGVRGYLISTYTGTGRPGENKRIVHLHAEDGLLMPGYPNPVFPPVAPEDVERCSQEWATRNGWSRVPGED